MKVINIIGTIIFAALVVWLAASWIDVVLHNMTTNAYAWWNIFDMFL